MSPHFNDYLGSDPLVYVRHLMKPFGFKKTPIPIEEIPASLKLTVEEIEPPPEQRTPTLHQHLVTVSGWLEREERKITIYKHSPRKRKRLTLCHEISHYIIPYHTGINPFCPDTDDPMNRKHTEQEAFVGAAAQIFYLRLFMPDLLSFNSPSLSAIESLAESYDASQEATANWYAKIHPGRCAIVVAGMPEVSVNGKNGNGSDSNGVLLADIKPTRKSGPIWYPPNGSICINGLPHTLQVNYAISSQRFPNWIPSSRRIPDTSMIFQCWQTGLPKSGEIPASDLGSSSPLRYFADCKPFQANGKEAVLALLWLQDKQLDLDISSPYAGW